MNSNCVNSNCRRTSNDASFGQKKQRDSLTPLEGELEEIAYPKSIFFIISNEFCERFNYHGMQTIQALYFTQKLMLDKSAATVLYHTFSTMVFFMCVFGAILSDCFLGKFKTIFYLSLVYALGSAIVAIGAVPTLNSSPIITTAIGFLLIAVGSGGIKPCVVAFGGDQFKLPAQLAQMASFYSMFYFIIYSGAVIATFFTPILRQDVHCFDENDCYSLAFGVPGILMIISIILFVSGKPLYTIHSPSGNMLVQVTKCIKHAIVTKCRRKETKPREHWLDYSEEKFGKQLVAETKILLKFLILFIPLPLFWSLFGQQGSRWTFQAQNMDGDIGFYRIKPDQMHVVYSLLALMFIPLIDTVIYPLLARIGMRRPLQKMSISMLLAAFTFLISGIVELELEKTYPIQPTEGEAQFRLINGLPCNFSVITNIPSIEQFELNNFGVFEEKYIEARAPTAYQFTLESTNPECPKPIRGKIIFDSHIATTVFVSGQEIREEDVYTDSSQRAQTPMLRILFSSLRDAPVREVQIITPSDNNRIAFNGPSSDRRLVSIIFGVHEVYIDGKYYDTIELKDGSISSLIVIDTPHEQTKFQMHLVEITPPNSMSMLWQLPQYIFMTMAEIMFSVTGYEFSYAQAPASMKSVMQASWLTTVALGNIIVMIVAGSRIFQSQANEFFLFTGLMVVDILLFMALAKNYKNASNHPELNPPTAASNNSIDVSPYNQE